MRKKRTGPEQRGLTLAEAAAIRERAEAIEDEQQKKTKKRTKKEKNDG